MDTGHDPHDAELIAALRHPAEVPLGLTARLEASVHRRARAEAGFTFEEKVVVTSIGLGALLLGGAVAAPGLALFAVLGAFGYAQWTILVDEEA